MDIFALVGRRALDVLAVRDVVPRGLGSVAVSVAVPRAGAPGDVVVDLGLVHAPVGDVADRLGAAPEVAAVAAIGGGRIAVTLSRAAILEAAAAVLDGRSPVPIVPMGREGAVSSHRLRSGRCAVSLADLRAEILTEMRAALAVAAGRDAPTGASAPAPVVTRGASAGPGPTRPDADAVLALIGAEAFRFAVASCRPDAVLRLDLRVLGDRCRADPSFWVPYAHARARKVLRRAAAVDSGPADLATADLSGLMEAGEIDLARLVARHAQVIAEAAAAAAPHRLAAHLREVADAVHRQWNRSKDQPQSPFVNEERRDLTKARLGLVTASALVLRSGLGLLGLSAPDEML